MVGIVVARGLVVLAPGGCRGWGWGRWVVLESWGRVGVFLGVVVWEYNGIGLFGVVGVCVFFVMGWCWGWLVGGGVGLLGG